MNADAISGIEPREETTLRLGGCGDCWYMTWTDDDRQLASGNDVRGWPWMLPRRSFGTRLYGVQGNPPDVSFEYLPDYPDHLCTRYTDHYENDYAGFGNLAVDGRIFQFITMRNKPAEPRFTGAKLIYSDDRGMTWHNQDGSSPVVWQTWEERSAENHIFFREDGDAFSVPCVLQMGQDYEHNRDGYVYIYAPNGSTDGTMNQLVMCRAPKKELLDRSSYEFFAGLGTDGTPAWAAEIEARQPVCTFPEGWVLPLTMEAASVWRLDTETQSQPHSWTPSVVYNEPLGVYMMVNWGMGIGDDGKWFGRPSYFGFWVADQPWGPWRQVHEDTSWTPGSNAAERAYEANISPKWISEDGRSLWLVWTDYQDVKGAVDASQIHELYMTGRDEEVAARLEERMPYYSMNIQKVELMV